MGKKLLKTGILLICILLSLPLPARVKPGIEVLRDMGFSVLKGKRVGLVTNPSGFAGSV